MIKHVVLFKLKNFDSEAEKEEALNKFKTMLLALENHISELKYIEVGQHFLIDSPSFDLCLITHFESLTDLDAYQVHPEHLKVGHFVKQISVNRAAVDYEF